MTNITEKEKEIVLKIFKDFTNSYNASSISKLVKMTRVGSYKALKNLEQHGILESKRLGKAIFYKIKLNDNYAKKSVELVLMEEANQKKRWLEEFKELFDLCESVILFGSILKSEEKANDIDLLLIMDQENNTKINKFIDTKNQILLKKIHPIKQTSDDFINNVKKKDKVILDAIETGIVLSGVENYVELINNAQK